MGYAPDWAAYHDLAFFDSIALFMTTQADSR
jgi:hypothetical protein